MAKAVFLDKDGTIVKDVPYNVDPGLIMLASGVPDALRRLQRAGYLLILITNQSGIARGYFTEGELIQALGHLQNILSGFGVVLDALYFCPHHPCGNVDKYRKRCECRKPNPGMLTLAAAEYDVDLTDSWMIGDILHDVEAGNRAGCRTILLDTGNETEWMPGEFRAPDYKVDNIAYAADIILAADETRHHDHNDYNNNSTVQGKEDSRYRGYHP